MLTKSAVLLGHVLAEFCKEPGLVESDIKRSRVHGQGLCVQPIVSRVEKLNGLPRFDHACTVPRDLPLNHCSRGILTRCML